MLVEHGSISSMADTLKDPVYACECDVGIRFYYAPSPYSIPDEAENNNTLAFVLSGFYHQCNDICICSIEGECYVQTGFYAYVDLVPYCEDDKCYVYAAVYTDDYNKGLKTEAGGLYVEPDAYNISVGINSGYIKVDSISCNGCARIKSSKCYGEAKKCIPPPETAGMTVYMGTYTTRIDKTTNPIATCQTTNGLKYFWPPSNHSMPDKAYRYAQEAFIINSAAWCPDFCIRTEDRKFYVPMTSDFFYFEFVPYCDLYAIERQFFTYPTTSYEVDGKNLTLIDVIDQDGISHDPGYGYNEIGPYCLDAYGTPDWVKDKDSYITDLLEINDTNHLVTSDYCVLAAIRNYKNFCGGKALEELLTVEASFKDLRITNFVLITVFGLPGLVFCVLVICLLKKESLISAFGIYCIVQSVNDIVLLVNNSFIEGYRNVKYLTTQSNDFYILGYNLDYILFYVNQCSCMICSSLAVLMTVNRFISLYFPFHYDRICSKKYTLIICGTLVGVILLGNLPLVVMPNICQSYYDGTYNTKHGCGSAYQFTQVYSDMVAITICLIFDVLTAIKLRQYIKKQKQMVTDMASKKRAGQEKLFFLQNCTKFVTFLIFLIPYIIVQHILKTVESYINQWWYRIIYMLYMYDCFRTMWRCVDEFMVYWFQRRLSQINKKQSIVKVSNTTIKITPVSKMEDFKASFKTIAKAVNFRRKSTAENLNVRRKSLSENMARRKSLLEVAAIKFMS